VLAGVATNVCVHATARDALHAGFLPVVLEDATASQSTEAHANALEDIRGSSDRWRRSRTFSKRGALPAESLVQRVLRRE
jgi:nicotinamidase-related amidase